MGSRAIFLHGNPLPSYWRLKPNQKCLLTIKPYEFVTTPANSKTQLDSNVIIKPRRVHIEPKHLPLLYQTIKNTRDNDHPTIPPQLTEQNLNFEVHHLVQRQKTTTNQPTIKPEKYYIFLHISNTK